MELVRLLAHPHEDDPGLSGEFIRRRHNDTSALGSRGSSFRVPRRVRRVTDQTLPVLADLGHRVERIDVRSRTRFGLVDIIAAAEAASSAPEDDELCATPGRLASSSTDETVTGEWPCTGPRARWLSHDTSCFDGSLRPVGDGDRSVEAFEPAQSRRAGGRPRGCVG